MDLSCQYPVSRAAGQCRNRDCVASCAAALGSRPTAGTQACDGGPVHGSAWPDYDLSCLYPVSGVLLQGCVRPWPAVASGPTAPGRWPATGSQTISGGPVCASAWHVICKTASACAHDCGCLIDRWQISPSQWRCRAPLPVYGHCKSAT